MKIRKSITYSVIFMVLTLLLYCLVDKDDNSYSTNIISYTENGSYVEYPQIFDLKDKKKQDSINQLLKDQVLFGTKNYMGEYIVNFSYPDYVYEFSSGVGFTNEYIASFWYSFDSYGEVDLGDGDIMRDTYRFFCITIDMKTGEKIDLSDFMIIDERLINSSDGTDIETNYNSAVNPTFHNFKDAFMVYTTEYDRDSFHTFSIQYTIDELKNTECETKWYIDENKNIVFCCITNFVSIPYNEISELICSKYLTALEN